MNAMQLLTGPLAQSIGWALLHLLWQATIVAGILAAVLALLPRRSANVRYAVSCGALALVFAMFVATAVRTYDPGAAPIATQSVKAAEPATLSLSKVPILLAEAATASWRDRATDRAMDAVAAARQSLPTIVAIWLAGVALLSSRLLVTWMRARRLATHGTSEAGAEWQRAAARLSTALGLRRAVRLLESAAVEVPSVLGSLRPVILLPASTLTGMTPEQIEMVLAHELAHIRRHDFLVNLMQAFVETLMFYHPAVWWMSRRVRIERENCCDDLAVGVCGNPLQYARALTRLEELRAMEIVVAANGGSLVDRIRRIAAGRAESTGLSSRWAAALLMLATLGVALALPSLPALAQRDKPAKKVSKSKASSAKVEVVETKEAAESAEDADDMFDLEIEAPYFEPPDADDLVVIPPIPPPVSPVVAIAPRAATAPMLGIPTPLPAPTPMPAIAGVAAIAPPSPTPMAMLGFGYMDDDSYDGDEPEKAEKEFGASGKLTVDELIQLRAVGVTPEYVTKMRAIDSKLTLRQIMHMRAVGVTPEYIAEMRAVGFDVTNARDLQSLRAIGVSAEYVRAMRAAGVELASARDAVRLHSMGVTPEFVKQLASAGYSKLSPSELARLAAVGVNADFIREMEKYRAK